MREVVLARRALTFVVAALALGGAVDLRRHADARGRPSSSSTRSSACRSWCSPAGPGRSPSASTPSPAWRPASPAMLAATHGWDFFAVMFTAGMVGALVAVLVGLPGAAHPGPVPRRHDAGVRVRGRGLHPQARVLRLAPARGGRATSRGRSSTARSTSSGDSELFGITIPADAKFYWLCLVFLGLAVALAAVAAQEPLGPHPHRGARQRPPRAGVRRQPGRAPGWPPSPRPASSPAWPARCSPTRTRASSRAASRPRSRSRCSSWPSSAASARSPAPCSARSSSSASRCCRASRDIELIELLTSGVGLLFLLMFLPGGLIEGVYRIRDNLLRRVAASTASTCRASSPTPSSPARTRSTAILDAEETALGTAVFAPARRRTVSLLRQRLDGVTGGAAIAPLVVLFGLNLVDELDRIAFGDPRPRDRRHVRHLRRRGHRHRHAGRASSRSSPRSPSSYLADRFNRVRLVAFAALAWSAISVLTGLAGWAGMLGLLVIARARRRHRPRRQRAGPRQPARRLLQARRAAPRVHGAPDGQPAQSAVTAVAIGALGRRARLAGAFLLLAIPTALLIARARSSSASRCAARAVDAELAARGRRARAASRSPRPAASCSAIRSLQAAPTSAPFFLGFGLSSRWPASSSSSSRTSTTSARPERGVVIVHLRRRARRPASSSGSGCRRATWATALGRLATPHRPLVRRSAASGCCSWRSRRGRGSSMRLRVPRQRRLRGVPARVLPARRADRAARGAHAGLRLLADPRRPRRPACRPVSSAASATAPATAWRSASLSLDRRPSPA